MNCLEKPPTYAKQPAQPGGWKAALDLDFQKRHGKTIISKRHHTGPLTIQRPFYPEDDVCHVYVLHPPGGIVGGDDLSVTARLTNNACALLTTPGATKFYRSNKQLARQVNQLFVEKGCTLEWFPQESIYFSGSYAAMTTEVYLSAGARFLGWEIQCYGRPAAAEDFTRGSVDSRFEIYRQGQPLLLDYLSITPDTGMTSATCLNSYPVSGTLVMTHADSSCPGLAREVACKLSDGDTVSGITRLDDVLVVRVLAHNSEQITRIFRAIWSEIRYKISGRKSCPPRIWST